MLVKKTCKSILNCSGCRDRGNSRFQQGDIAQDHANWLAHQMFCGYPQRTDKKTQDQKNPVGICIYLVIFENTQGRPGTRPSVVKTLWWTDSVGTESTRSLEQQIPPVLEITETQHPHPLVGLFVHLSEGQSAAADRCVCKSIFGGGSCSEVSCRFPHSVPPGGKTKIKSGCSRLTFSHLSPGLVW